MGGSGLGVGGKGDKWRSWDGAIYGENISMVKDLREQDREDQRKNWVLELEQQIKSVKERKVADKVERMKVEVELEERLRGEQDVLNLKYKQEKLDERGTAQGRLDSVQKVGPKVTNPNLERIRAEIFSKDRQRGADAACAVPIC